MNNKKLRSIRAFLLYQIYDVGDAETHDCNAITLEVLHHAIGLLVDGDQNIDDEWIEFYYNMDLMDEKNAEEASHILLDHLEKNGSYTQGDKIDIENKDGEEWKDA
jgi:hypothetical protein